MTLFVVSSSWQSRPVGSPTVQTRFVVAAMVCGLDGEEVINGVAAAAGVAPIVTIPAVALTVISHAETTRVSRDLPPRVLSRTLTIDCESTEIARSLTSTTHQLEQFRS